MHFKLDKSKGYILENLGIEEIKKILEEIDQLHFIEYLNTNRVLFYEKDANLWCYWTKNSLGRFLDANNIVILTSTIIFKYKNKNICLIN